MLCSGTGNECGEFCLNVLVDPQIGVLQCDLVHLVL